MITTITLNPALDKIFKLNNLNKGKLNRLEETIERAGGKGLNVARVVHKIGARVLSISTFGGYTGEYMQKLIEAEGIPNKIIWSSYKTRENIKIVEKGGKETEINQKGCVEPEDYSKFLSLFKKELKRTEILVLAGSLPEGLSSDTYKQLINLAKKENVKTILDTSGQALKFGIETQPFLIKPNVHELRALFQKELKKIGEIIDAAKILIDKGINTVVVSLGSKGALYIRDDKYYRVLAPKVKILESTVGAGDSMVAALSIAIRDNYSLQEISIYTTSIASLFLSGADINTNNIKQMKNKLKLIDEVDFDEIV
ncbi:MAG: 1-phosphofructokinase [Halanaerobiales bacterium]